MRNSLKTLLIFLAVFSVRFFVGTIAFNHDVVNHMVWADSIKDEGLSGFYRRNFLPYAQANYPPLSNFLFLGGDYLYKFLFPLSGNEVLRAVFYKLPGIIIESAVIVYFLKVSVALGMLLFFNPGIWYNTLLWGQLEGLMTGIVFFSLWAFYHKGTGRAIFLFTLSCLVKQSAEIFAPLIIVLSLKKFDFQKAVTGTILSLAVIWLSFSFFDPAGWLSFPVIFYLRESGGQAHQYLASVNAFNFWYLLGLNNLSDAGKFINITWRWWGIIASMASVIYIVSILFMKKKITFFQTLAAAGLINFALCLFMTRVHERHLLPTLILLLPMATKSLADFTGYVSISLAHFLNLWWVWRYPHISLFSFMDNPLWGMILSVMFIFWFCYFLIKWVRSYEGT